MENVKSFIQFINNSPSVFHVINNIELQLKENGFEYLKEGSSWKINKGGKYYTKRNGSSIIAFKVGKELNDYHYQISASHADSPTYKVKHMNELNSAGEYIKLNVEAYGGTIDSTWLDKPLSLAGRVLVKEDNKVLNKLLYIDKDILLIPNLAIHFNRQVNTGYAWNRQVDLCPLFTNGELKTGDFNNMIADYLNVESSQIMSKDLYLVNRQQPTIWGYKDEFISSPKLDDLECAYTSLQGFINGNNEQAINLYCCFDNEEVGSTTKQGAKSTFLIDTLNRINNNLNKTSEDLYQALAKSFMISCDNAHAVHPNHPEKTDVNNCTYMNKGIVIKENAFQRYTTDAFSRAIFESICKEANVPVQYFANRSDSLGGGTLGHLSSSQVSIPAIDIGLAQLAMHSSYETAGSKDITYMIQALTNYYNSNIKIDEAEEFSID